MAIEIYYKNFPEKRIENVRQIENFGVKSLRIKYIKRGKETIEIIRFDNDARIVIVQEVKDET